MNRQEKRWISLISAHGCVICQKLGRGYEPCEIHHLIRAGKRIGHLHTVGLCSSHHRGVPPIVGEPSRHGAHKKFNEEYGGEVALWKELVRLLTE